MSTIDLNLIRSLSVTDRLTLVEAIWDSIAEEQGQLPITDEQRAELDDRIADMEADPHSGSSWEEVKARLRQER